MVQAAAEAGLDGPVSPGLGRLDVHAEDTGEPIPAVPCRPRAGAVTGCSQLKADRFVRSGRSSAPLRGYEKGRLSGQLHCRRDGRLANSDLFGPVPIRDAAASLTPASERKA
ncbi:hypothetical protein GCM10010260_59220 [Streptomyces filipinensis]|uniref:Uncharacterized protein n=1 Tax=Streptomyces filipinensis TaxID=66887 RepID=A0A918IG80_9ACTN|nr:hypothetical protein GCM10010260_59220 [Streptomyces filipinensis]